MQTEYTNFNKEQTYIYIGFVSTPGLFASMIRRVIEQKYVHVVLGLDEGLEEAYSVGRRNPAIPILAGFEQEEKDKILRVFPNAEYMICRIPCSIQQKEYIKEILHQCMKDHYHIHYTVLGLPFLLCNIPFYQKGHYTCSSFLARLLEEAGILRFDKHFSLVTPRDFMEYQEKEVIFEGALRELVSDRNVYTTGVVKYEG